MKNLKEIIIGIFAVIGVLALVTGFTNKVAENEVGTYQIEIESTESGWGSLYRLNTKTGEIVKIKQTALKKIEIN